MAERPVYAVAPSVCHSLPNFQAVDLFPIRSPLAVADFLGPRLRGHSFAEIGTRNGDVMSCLAHFAKEVIAVEMDEGYCRKLRSRGYTVVCQNSETIPLTDFPMADARAYAGRTHALAASATHSYPNEPRARGRSTTGGPPTPVGRTSCGCCSSPARCRSRAGPPRCTLAPTTTGRQT